MAASQGSDQGASNGGIFEGTKFWLSHRIPDRANMIALVKRHGGLVEAFDKRADIIIADHARRDAPPNSFSWRLITESDKAGRFVDKEPHRIGRPPSEPRPVASAEAVKSRRVPYSPADDALLAAWVSRSTQKSGNKIYQELEAAHPHHTWHSWRDRWLKHIRLLPVDVQNHMAQLGAANGGASPAPASSAPTGQASPPSAPTGKATAAAATNRRRPHPQTTPSKTKQPPPVQSPAQVLRPMSPGKREEPSDFNEDDDALVEKYVKALVENGERWNDVGIYEELAKEHPHHSAQSWKERFADLWRDNRISMKNWNSTGRSVSRSSTEEDQLPEESVVASQEVFPDADDPTESFYRSYSVWVNEEAKGGRTREVVKWHLIQGRKFELWNLYEAVLGQGCPIDEVKWELVAENMGFRRTSILHASEALDGCWDKYLSQFHNDTSAFEAAELDDFGDNSSSAEDGDDASRGEDGSEDEDASGAENSSGDRVAPTPQRNHDSSGLARRPWLTGSHRKRRLDRNAEIPSSSPLVKPKPGHTREAGDTSPPKRRRLFKGAYRRHDGTDANGDEDIYEASPSRELSAPRDAIDSSPLPVRPRDHHESAAMGSSTARGHTRRSDAASGHSTAGRHAGRDATLGSGTAREDTERADESRPHAPTPRSAPRHRTLPSAITPEPEHHSIIDDDDDDGNDDKGGDEVQTIVEQLVREGYPRSMAVEAIYRTSFALDRALTRTVLTSLERGDGVPGNRKGVWTAVDDEELRSVDAVDMSQPTENLQEHKRRESRREVLKGLVRKHGSGNVEVRRHILADAEEAGFKLS